MINLELGEVEIVNAGQKTDRRFHRAAAVFATVEDPFQHTHVVAKTRPKKFSRLPFAEPIHIKYEGRIRESFADVEPVPEIIADVVATEREHRHRIAPDLTDCAGRSCGCFRSHR